MLGQATDEAICEVRWLSATVKHSDDVEGIFLGDHFDKRVEVPLHGDNFCLRMRCGCNLNTDGTKLQPGQVCAGASCQGFLEPVDTFRR